MAPVTLQAFGVDPALLERARAELDAAAVTVEAAPDDRPLTEALAGCDGALIADRDKPSWRDRLAALHQVKPDLGVVLVTDDPTSLWVTAALRNRRVCAVLSGDPRPGEVAAACLAVIEVTALRREAAEQRRLAQHRVEVMATLNEVSAATADLGSYLEVLEVVTRELHRVVRFDLVAILAAVDPTGAILHLHVQEACDASLVRAVRDRCLESFRASTGRALDEDQLAVHLTGRPLLTAGQASRPPATTQVPLISGGHTVGLLFLSSSAPDSVSPNSVSTDERRVLYLVAHRTADALVRLKGRLGDERRRLGLMVQSMADGLILTDAHSDQVLINPAARRLLGIEGMQPITQQFLKQTLGFYPFDLVTTGDGGAGVLREEVRVKDKILHSMVSPVRDAGGKLDGVVVVLRDFTEARALARRQTEFVSAVSHELRSPLTTITGALDIVLSEYAGRLSDKQRRYAQLARESCTRLNQIVDDLLDVARSDRGRIAVNLTPILLDELGRDAVDRFRQAAQARGIRLMVKTEVGGIRIVGDPDRLTQVLNNLLSNAVKFTPNGGLIEVEIFGPQVASGQVGVAVYNNGDPIPEEARERIFEKFERLEGDNRQVGGTGLGLAISRAIVEAHSGHIWVESRTEGTKFVFTLPSAPDTGVGERAAVEAQLPAGGDPTGSTVLVVDDDDYSGYILKGILMGAGHEVLAATSAEDALATARARRPALVILNANLADDALGILRTLKHDPETRKSAVVVLVSGDDREEILRAGADEVAQKPIQPPQFRDLCTRLIEEAGRARAHRVLVVDDDPSIRTICREVLESAGYSVREAGGGHQARSEVHRFKPDLVMLDVMMPGMDGFETAEMLRGEPATSLVPIIFLSAKGETADKVRAFRLGAEDYVVKPFIAAELLARVRKALERRERELGASPTTQLPGAGAIEVEFERRLLGGEPVAFCYLDLDNLKAFNDYYGYAKADGIIRQTADLLRDVVSRTGTPADFIGHIAGDDFVFITAESTVDEVCTTLCSAFDRLIPLYYNKGDRERGFIEAKDRFGVLRRFPIMSVSLVAVTASGAAVRSYSELATAAATGKKMAKGLAGSSYVRDGRAVVGGGPALEGSEVAS